MHPTKYADLLTKKRAIVMTKLRLDATDLYRIIPKIYIEKRKVLKQKLGESCIKLPLLFGY